ncbi:helix-turn-helix domain-containing protein [uncultured Roseibium sp.]|uniref:helix-turn-helix domain-containing protein n=1 Tax=uncultured Roseibium sp. TaxID=1936171 RepID=UPI002620F5D4|nr:helix-turn-helix domain-containing protein [uncultured Roseibium sp.]
MNEPEQSSSGAPSPFPIVTEQDRIASEREAIENALRACNGRVSGKGGAAELMSVKPTTLYSRLKRFGIDAKTFKA